MRRVPSVSTGSRTGVALMLALWVLVALGAASLQILAAARVRVDAGILARSSTVARYAAESGLVVAQARLEELVADAETPEEQARLFEEFRDGLTVLDVQGVGTGRFQVVAEDLNARVDLNRSRPIVVQGLLEQFVPTPTAEELVRVLRPPEPLPSSSLNDFDTAPADVDTVTATFGASPGAVPFLHLEAIARLPGFGDSLVAALAPHVTLWSDGFIDVNAASPVVLASVPGIGIVNAQALEDRRERGGPFASKVAVAAELSQGSSPGFDSRLPDLTTVPRRVLLISRGWEVGSSYTHEVQAVFDVLVSRLVTGTRVRLRSWSERGR